MFLSIKPIILRFRERPNILRKLNEQRLQDNWDEIVSSVIPGGSRKSEVAEIRGNEIIVRVRNTVWLQEMFFYKQELDKKASQFHKDIKGIRFVL